MPETQMLQTFTQEERIVQLAKDAAVSEFFLRAVILTDADVHARNLHITSFEKAVEAWNALKDTDYAGDAAGILAKFIGEDDFLRTKTSLALLCEWIDDGNADENDVVANIFGGLQEKLDAEIEQRTASKDPFFIKSVLELLPKGRRGTYQQSALRALAELREITLGVKEK